MYTAIDHNPRPTSRPPCLMTHDGTRPTHTQNAIRGSRAEKRRMRRNVGESGDEGGGGGRGGGGGARSERGGGDGLVGHRETALAKWHRRAASARRRRARRRRRRRGWWHGWRRPRCHRRSPPSSTTSSATLAGTGIGGWKTPRDGAGTCQRASRAECEGMATGGKHARAGNALRWLWM